MNPCPCGYYPDVHKCRCTPHEVRRYLERISGPVLDRIDICVEAPAIKVTALREKTDMGVKEIREYCKITDQEERLLEQAFTALGLTARSYHRILKVARTIADLNADTQITERHLTEAICYRMTDRKYLGQKQDMIE